MSDSGNSIIQGLLKRLETGAKDATAIKYLLKSNNDARRILERIADKAIKLNKECWNWYQGTQCNCGYCALSEAIYILDRWNDKL